MDSKTLVELIRKHRPWHQNIQFTPEVDVRSAFEADELVRKNNENVAFIDHHDGWVEKVNLIFPNGVEGKSFLDCACNAGSYCFWMRDMGASQVHGFDVRQHWIDQANLIKEHRTVHPTDGISFDVCDLMQLPNLDIEAADFVLFKGIFYHLADPIRGLKIAADLCKDTILVNTSRMFVEDDRSLHCAFEQIERKMSGAHSLSWIPTGPKVIAMMLYWMGFVDIWHVFSKRDENNPKHGRMEVVASRNAGQLDAFEGHEHARRMPTDGYRHAKKADDDMLSLH